MPQVCLEYVSNKFRMLLQVFHVLYSEVVHRKVKPERFATKQRTGNCAVLFEKNEAHKALSFDVARYNFQKI